MTRGRVVLLGVVVVVIATLASTAPILSRLVANPENAEPVTGVTEVAIPDSAFDPAAIAVPPGTEITRVFADDEEHNVVFDDGPASPVQVDGTWSRTFEQTGEHHYSCTLHVGMDGRVVVTR